MNKMKIIFTVICFFGNNSELFSQIQEKLLLACNDSTILNKLLPKFDDKGNFLYRIETDSGDFVIMNNDTIGPMFGYAVGGMSNHSHRNKEKGDFYLSSKLPFCYGPTTGSNWSYFRRPESKNRMHEAVVIQEDDHISIFIDGKLIKQIDTLSRTQILLNGEFSEQLKNKKRYLESDDWAYLSDNGNVIYSLEENRVHHLYVNHVLVDTSLMRFEKPMINDEGDYIFYKTLKIGSGDSVKYIRYVHTKDTLIGPIEKFLWNHSIMNNGGYFYLDIDKWNSHILINNTLYIDSVEGKVKSILLPNEKHFLCLKEIDKRHTIFFTDTVYSLDYEQVYLPTIDRAGNSSMFVIDDYHLYTWKNGKRGEFPITKFGVRPKPISLDAQGNTVVFYEVNDSSYIFRNDDLLFQAKNDEIRYSELKNCVSYFPSREIYSDGQNLIFLTVKDSSYIIQNAEISKSFLAVTPMLHLSSRDAELGEIVTGGVVEGHYYFIWKEDMQKFTILLDGKVIGSLEGVDRVFNRSAINGNSLVFYGIRNLSLYQYTINF